MFSNLFCCIIALLVVKEADLAQGHNETDLSAGIIRANHRMLSEISHKTVVLQEKLDAISVTLKSLDSRLSSLEAQSVSSNKPRDCFDIQARGHNISGVYKIYPGYPCSGEARKVYCELQEHGGNWLVFHKRFDGSVDFQRNWEDYTLGFGDPKAEYWLGNRYLHLITNQRRYEMRVNLWDFDDDYRYATYTYVTIGSEREGFLAQLGEYAGDAGDGLNVWRGSRFTTFDRDNDIHGDNCAVFFKGGWWYSKCHGGCLNCLYLKGDHESYADGMEWRPWRGNYSLRRAEMMIRPVGVQAP